MTAPTFRAIETESYAKVEPPASLGRPPRLEWLAIRQLVVDPEYQREITLVGRKNIRRIVAGFNWSMFAPVVVAAAGSNQFAIVDGQHRVTAAALVGVDKVPCAIIEAVRGEQAAAFRAINANTTRLHTVQLFHAAVASGEASALAVLDVCRRGGITIPKTPGPRKQCETLCVGTVAKAADRFGIDVTVTGLKAIVHSGDGSPLELNKTIIWGVVEVLHGHPEWCRTTPPLMLAFEDFNLEEMWRAATAAAAKIRGSSSTLQFEAALTAALAAFFEKTKRRA